jgi:inner membrane protein
MSSTEPTATPSPEPATRGNGLSWIRTSMTFRVAVLAILALLLLIPLSMVQGLIREREWRKEEAQREVSSTWGGPQTLVGPVISVPYDQVVRVRSGDQEELKTVRHHAHFLPDALDITMELLPEKRHRGIYDVVVYRARFSLKGRFAAPAENDLRLEGRLKWQEAFVSVGVSDLRSLREQVRMRLGGNALSFEPGAPVDDVMGTAVHALVDLGTGEEALDFTMDLQVNGSAWVRMVPVGRVTTAYFKSAWPDPKFAGAFLPDTSTIAAEGTTARWTVLHLNRSYPQVFTGDRAREVEDSAFGVDLVLPVDEYRKSDRASKYGFMLICLVFLVFFFVEVLQKLRIHPIQYLLVGLALSLFYTLLIAISEHTGFGRAYGIATAATIGLVVFYAASVFRMPRATRILALVMVFVYGFMFTIIHQEDYALLIGSIGLFVVLAVVMALSRRIDWYGGSRSAS